MKDNTKNVPPEPTLAERRKRLAEALGFLLARAWQREHGQDRQAHGQPDLRGNPPQRPP